MMCCDQSSSHHRRQLPACGAELPQLSSNRLLEYPWARLVRVVVIEQPRSREANEILLEKKRKRIEDSVYALHSSMFQTSTHHPSTEAWWTENATEVELEVNATDMAFVTREGRSGDKVTFVSLQPPNIVDLGIGFGHLEGAQLRAALSIMTILELLVIVSNILVIAAIRRHRLLRTTTNLYIISLAVSDLFCALGMPIGLLAKYIPDIFLHSVYICILPFCLLMTVLASAILNLLAVSIDRYLALIKPLRYQVMMTKRKSLLFITGAWSLSFLVGFISMVWQKPPYYDPHSNRGYCEWDRVVTVGYMFLYSVLILAIPILVIIGLYIQIFCIARTHAKSIDKTRTRVFSPRPDASTVDSVSMAALQAPVVSRLKKASDDCSSTSVSTSQRLVISLETRVAITIGVIVCTFAVCWLPLTITLLLSIFCKDSCGVTAEVRGWLGILTLVNSFFNPIIYTARTKEFRDAFTELCSKSKAWCLTRSRRCYHSGSDDDHSRSAAYFAASKSSVIFEVKASIKCHAATQTTQTTFDLQGENGIHIISKTTASYDAPV
ncbi:adenosine receptor A1-like [Diadema setosum]|uniref:adenosine receptor A1-like n=1 Tax=Diadema setosum TaxID=31175 RepID=UPI003B3A3732